MKVLKKLITTCRKCPLKSDCMNKNVNVDSYSTSYGINPHCPLPELLSPCCHSKVKKVKNILICKNCYMPIEINL